MELLLTLTLSGSALALFLFALRYLLLRRMPSTVYYYAWLLVLLRFALPLPGLIPVSGASDAPDAAYRETYVPYRAEQESGIPFADTAPAAAPAPQTPAHTGDRPETAAAPGPAASSGPVWTVDWRSPGLWHSLWAQGSILSLGLTVCAYLRFALRLRRSLRRPDRLTRELYASIPGRKPLLFISSGVRTPMMYGVLSPRIVLPERTYDRELLGNILRHELMHYRRLDTLYKWIAAAILSAHWFNPLSWLVRKELSRACELSCDEMLLRSMTRAEKQSYGNALLSVAAVSALPAGVVATTFATEKRDLKERLEGIMNYKKSPARLLAAVLALALLAGCGAAAGPQSHREEAGSGIPSGAVSVSDVDEFLAALAPNTTIFLEAGAYDLSTAADYGAETDSPYYSWRTVWGKEGETNAELVIQGVDNLTIDGAGMEKTTIAAVPRYANVISFQDCHGLSVSRLTAGHTEEPGFCSGGVLRFENCSDVSVIDCGLFGCGTIGVDANDTTGLRVTGCSIYECSYGAVDLHTCRDVRIEDCDVYRHGLREGEGTAMSLFGAYYSDGVVIHGNRIYENAAQFLLQLNYTKNAAFLSNDVHDNRFDASVFQFEQYGATVDGCAFRDNDTRGWVQSSGVYANDTTGKLLDASDFEAMTLREIDPDIAVTPSPVSAAAQVRPGGSIRVTDVDEFLAAIGPDRTIVLDGELFDLSSASNYGSVGGEYYYWSQTHDGPELVIQNVRGLSIRSASGEAKSTVLAALPRYANVLYFRDCDDLVLSGFTAGHTREPGSCAGGVLYFQNCDNVRTDDMRLYGCGILGVQASGCTSVDILRTEIYECSQGAGQFFQCDGLRFDGCDIHDVPSPAFTFTECGDKSWNSEPISGLNGSYDVDGGGELVPVNSEDSQPGPYGGGISAFTYPEDSPEMAFAASVRSAVADGDWEKLADMIAFPLRVVDAAGGSREISDRAEFLAQADQLFPEEFRQTVAAAPLDEFGGTIYGVTFCRHLLAFSFFVDETNTVKYLVTVISVREPLWTGEFSYVMIEPAPVPPS